MSVESAKALHLFFNLRGPYCHHRAFEQAKRGMGKRVYPKVRAQAISEIQF